ncbi:MAG: KamA family radical SAM protein [Bdellovibrionota bacterium]|nr:KamA family radical SAM protein [Bdellovibrionota bacterium]
MISPREKLTSHLEAKLAESAAIRKQFLYSNDEEDQTDGLLDPIGDALRAKGNGIIHRYKNRILFMPTTACPVNCRYCFRRNELVSPSSFLKGKLNELETYLKKHPEVEEVILTGGDPLVLNNQRLEEVFKILIKCGTRFLRIHTRAPAVDPTRIDDGFLKLIEKFQASFKRIFLVIHTNHPDELDSLIANSIEKLNGLKITLLSQSVLLKGVNDDAEILKRLMERLVEIGITPYYLHHPDKVKGAMHFYLSEDEGLKIYRQLKSICSGWAIPHYILDSSEGTGKKFMINQTL